jgi:hypothetical protein
VIHPLALDDRRRSVSPSDGEKAAEKDYKKYLNYAYGNDFNPPLAPQLTYTAFVSSSLLGTIRVGPENFDGILLSD